MDFIKQPMDIENKSMIDDLCYSHFTHISKIEQKIGSDNTFVIKMQVSTRKNLVTINEIFKKSPYIQKIEIQEIYE